MAKKLNRRDFIKISGAGAGALAVGGKFYSSYAKENKTFYPSNVNKDGKIEKTPTYCEICFWKCAGWTYTVDGEPWKVVGNDIDHHCNGRF